jgi:hypothetical protein
MPRQTPNEAMGEHVNDLVLKSLVQLYVIDEMADQHARGAHWDTTQETVAYKHNLGEPGSPTPTEVDYIAATGAVRRDRRLRPDVCTGAGSG